VIGLCWAERSTLGIRTIGAVDCDKRKRVQRPKQMRNAQPCAHERRMLARAAKGPIATEAQP
jgi:hypothetical protein